MQRVRHGEAGFTLVETLAAILVLTVGVLGMMMGFDSARKLSLVSERHTAMALTAQQEVERVQGLAYSQIALTVAPSTSTDPANPDYYVVAGPPVSYQYKQTAGVSEPLVVDGTTGQVDPVNTWSEGSLSGSIYDFVTAVTDPRCSPGCPASGGDYKRVTVAVTLTLPSGVPEQPLPVYTSSVVVDPAAAASGVSNGKGNPLVSPMSTCQNSQGQTVSCTSPILGGSPNTFFLHDWPATGGTPQAPSGDHATRPTVGIIGGLLCILGNTAGCPVPDVMDANQPAGTTGSTGTTGPFHYSTDQCANSCYPGGQLLQPTCSGTSACGGSPGGTCTGSGCGTGSTSDCSNGSWTSTLLSVQTGFWVSAPLSASMTLTGDGGLSMFTQTVGSAQALVSFCVEIYDVPPSNGIAGSLSNLLTWPPVALGGAGYVAATNPGTGANWPTSPTQLSYIFNFRGSGGTVTIAAGHRIGLRIWAKANINAAIDLLFDNPSYPTQLELNSQ